LQVPLNMNASSRQNYTPYTITDNFLLQALIPHRKTPNFNSGVNDFRESDFSKNSYTSRNSKQSQPKSIETHNKAYLHKQTLSNLISYKSLTLSEQINRLK
jgi:hypothetical protein